MTEKTKGERRQAKRDKRRLGMKVSGRSVFVIDRAIVKRADAAKAKQGP